MTEVLVATPTRKPPQVTSISKWQTDTNEQLPATVKRLGVLVVSIVLLGVCASPCRALPPAATLRVPDVRNSKLTKDSRVVWVSSEFSVNIRRELAAIRLTPDSRWDTEPTPVVVELYPDEVVVQVRYGGPPAGPLCPERGAYAAFERRSGIDFANVSYALCIVHWLGYMRYALAAALAASDATQESWQIRAVSVRIAMPTAGNYVNLHWTIREPSDLLGGPPSAVSVSTRKSTIAVAPLVSAVMPLPPPLVDVRGRETGYGVLLKVLKPYLPVSPGSNAEIVRPAMTVDSDSLPTRVTNTATSSGSLASGPRVRGKYRARLSEADHRDSKGFALQSAIAVIVQDRANYHRFGLRDLGDEGDELYVDMDSRRSLAVALSHRINPSIEAEIESGIRTIEVTTYSDGAVEVVLLNEDMVPAAPTQRLQRGRAPE